PRVRLAVGRPPGRQDPADYVLAPIPKRLAEDFGVLVERGADAVMDVVRLPLAEAQKRNNGWRVTAAARRGRGNGRGPAAPRRGAEPQQRLTEPTGAAAAAVLDSWMATATRRSDTGGQGGRSRGAGGGGEGAG